jgi:hypothetical protein
MYVCMCVYIVKTERKKKKKQTNNGKSFKNKTNKAKIDVKYM